MVVVVVVMIMQRLLIKARSMIRHDGRVHYI